MSRLSRPFIAVCCLALVSTMGSAPLAQADSETLPPTIAAIVSGDVTSYQWMLNAVNAPGAWTSSTGAGAVVAVIDTGVDATHPDLAGQVVRGAFVTEDAKGKKILVSATVERTSDDWYGHGSHVAGIIAANDDGNGVTGIAPDAQIMPIALLGRKGVESDLDWMRMITAGIEYASAHGADVINMSLGGQSSGIAESPRTHKYLANLEKVCDAVDAATATGTVVVASAGNSGSWGNPEIVPASCPTTVTVAALAPSFERTYWSSFDAAVDISAPGLDILSVDSTVADLSPTPQLMASGTSMASPVVAGVAALLSSAHPGWTAGQIISAITAGAQDIDVPGRDPDTGYGIVDAAASLGVATPPAEPSDDFSTWADALFGGPANGQAVIGWTTPDVHAVTGYTVTVHTLTGTTAYELDAGDVRVQVDMVNGDGWTVTAHTTNGDVTTYPNIMRSWGYGGGEQPERLRHIKLERARDTIIVSWDKPTNRESIDVIEARLRGDRGGYAYGKLKVDQNDKFPTSMKVRLPKAARWYDLSGYLILRNRDDDGHTVGYDFVPIKDASAAIHGSRIDKITSAGRHAVEVTGRVSVLHAQRVCGNKSCVGELATLVIDRGSEVQRVAVRFNAEGAIHATVWRPAGAKSLKLRLEGPLRLDSGPFQRVHVER